MAEKTVEQNDEFLTVSELNHFIRDVLNSGFPKSLWVCGEIQGYDRGKDKKHVFFELCEKDPATRDITARIGLGDPGMQKGLPSQKS